MQQPTLDPMDGCPFCEWHSEGGQTWLAKPCKLHEDIAELQQNAVMDKRVIDDLQNQINSIKDKVGEAFTQLDEVLTTMEE